MPGRSTPLVDALTRAVTAPDQPASGQVLARELDRFAYASDASHYAMTPEAVVRPGSIDDITRLFATAQRMGTALTFRSGGTSLSGQGVTEQVLVDTRRHFRGIEVLDNGRRVGVGVGTVLRDVNAVLARSGRRLGPDPASETACTVGGIVANNSSGMSCGTSANAYSTLDSLVFALPGGTVVDTSRDDAEARLRHDEPALYESIGRMRDDLRSDPDAVAEIRRQFAMKNTMGYSVNAFLDHDRVVDILGRLMVGSEGTLGFVAHTVFRTVPLRPHRRTGLLVMPGLDQATAAVSLLVDSGAQVVELLDATSLRVAQSDPSAPEYLRALAVGGHAGLLVEYQEQSADELDATRVTAEDVVRDLDLSAEGAFTTDPGERAALWHIRKGLFTAAAAARPAGTTSLLEDIAVPPESLTAAGAQLRTLLDAYGYCEAAIFGHARDANLHFLIAQPFAEAADIARYAEFTDDLVDLVLGHRGTLKAEHGTGRVMAPFVRRQYGDRIYQVMRDVKSACDPARILSPNVIITDDEELHLRNLKSITPVDNMIDACVECGYCEPQCPSRSLTTTPRQRIALARAAARPDLTDEQRRSLRTDYEYDAVATCAADGLCQTACPVGIDTGAYMKQLRAQEHGAFAQSAAAAAARHWGTGTRLARWSLIVSHGLPAAVPATVTRLGRRLAPHSVPQWTADLPAARARRPGPRHSSDALAVFFPSCLDAVVGPADGSAGAADALLRLATRAGVALDVPEGIDRLCCSMPWRSKGYTHGAAVMSELLHEALVTATDHGRLPVVTDAASCTYGLVETLNSAGLSIVDVTTFAAEQLLPRLTVRRRLDSLAVHPTCSTTHLGATDALLTIARAIADDVIVPDDWGCCGFAGDRGLLVPELTASATAPEAAELASREAAGYASANRTCEVGLTRATGRPYRHILEHLDDATTEHRP